MITKTAHACSCAQPQPIATELQNADAVFTGRVIEIDKPLVMTSSLDPIRVTLDVSETWKGADQKIVEVSTASSGVSCGYTDFEKGEEYLIFAHQSESGLDVNRCSRTQRLARATDDVAQLQTIQEPQTPSETNSVQTNTVEEPKISEEVIIIDSRYSILGVFGAAIILLVLYYLLWQKKVSKWERPRRILFACLFGFFSIGFLLNIYFMSFGPAIARGEFDSFLLSSLFFIVLWPLLFGLGAFGALAIPGVIGFIAMLIAWIKGRKWVAVGILCTFLFLFGSLFIPTTVSSREELSNLTFGKPFAFVAQNMSAYAPTIPTTMGFGIVKEHPIRIRWPQFFLSLAIVGGGVAALLAGGRMVVRQVRPREGQRGRD